MVFNTADESQRNDSTVTVTFSYPFARGAATTYTTSDNTGLTGISIDAASFAGALGSDAANDSYVFKYISETGWTFNGGSTAVQLANYGLSGEIQYQPLENATITVTLTITEETIRLRNFQVYDLTLLGLEGISVSDADNIVGKTYHSKAVTNAIAGGYTAQGTDLNEFNSEISFCQLRALPPARRCLRHLTLPRASFTAGSPPSRHRAERRGHTSTAHGAEPPISHPGRGDIGSVSGTTLTLTQNVSGATVYYELASPELTNITEPAVYRVATGGGVEHILRYDSAAGGICQISTRPALKK